jgi:RimJ/RimL family protein N-acetyltransferase
VSNHNWTRETEHRTDDSASADRIYRGWWLREPEREDVNDIAAWLAEPAINQWFDFGLGRQSLPTLAVQLMLQSRRHRLRVFGPHGHHAASGLVAVSDIAHAFGTGSFWVLRDSRRPTCTDMTFLASRQVLQDAFGFERLRCITAWAVDCNVRSLHLLGHLGFRAVGTQRDCHVMHGSRFARVLFDLLPGELASNPVTPPGNS